MENFPVAASSKQLAITAKYKSNTPAWLSEHPIWFSLWESMSSATQLGTYAKFTPKLKATMLAILHVPSATLANWPFRR